MKDNPELVVMSLAFFLIALFLIVVMVAPDYVLFVGKYFFGFR